MFVDLASTIMGVAGDIPEICTVHMLAYDDDGQATGDDLVTITGVRAFREDYTVEKVDNQTVLRNDRQYLIAAKDLGAEVPEEDDLLDFGGGEFWTIVRVETDPAEATYTLQCRK